MKSLCAANLNNLSDDRGQAMVLVVSLLAVVFVLVTGTLLLASNSASLNSSKRSRIMSYYIAEAGVQRAVYAMTDKLVYPVPGFEGFRIENQDCAGGVIELVYVEKSETVSMGAYSVQRFTVCSRARYPKEGMPVSRKGLRVVVEVSPDPFLIYGGLGIRTGGNLVVPSSLPTMGADGEPGEGAKLHNFELEESLVAKGDIDIQARNIIDQCYGVVAAGGDVNLGQTDYPGSDTSFSGGSAERRGRIQAGGDVNLDFGEISWTGDIYTGGSVNVNPGVTTPNVAFNQPPVPDLMVPDFPQIGKTSKWYDRVRRLAIDNGTYYRNQDEFLKGILGWSTLDKVDIYIHRASLTLGQSVYLIEGGLKLDGKTYSEYLDRFKEERKRDNYGHEVNLHFLNDTKSLDLISNDSTLVADSITISNEKYQGYSVDTTNIEGPLGLFGVGDEEDSVSGDVYYLAGVSSGARLTAIANGRFRYGRVDTDVYAGYIATREDFIWGPDMLNPARYNLWFTVDDNSPSYTPAWYRIISCEEL